MKNRLKVLALVATTFSMFGCVQENASSFSAQETQLSAGVSILSISPADKATNVEPVSRITIKLSSPISSKISDFNFFVTDDTGALVSGQLIYSSNPTEITFARIIDGIEFGFDLDTTYNVTVQFLKDLEGYDLGPLRTSFRTSSAIASGSNFKPLGYVNKKWCIYPNDPIIAEFNLPIDTSRISLDGQGCSNDLIDVFQVKVFDFRNAEGRFALPNQAGRACLVCEGSLQNCRKIGFYPITNGRNEWPNESGVSISINKNAQKLFGRLTQNNQTTFERLSTGFGEQWKSVIRNTAICQ